MKRTKKRRIPNINRKLPKALSVPIKKDEKIYTLKQLQTSMTIHHREFVHAYIKNGWNGTQAYIEVYGHKSTDNVAASSASFLLRLSKVKQYLAFMRENTEVICNISKQKQLQEYMIIAYSGIDDIQDDWISLKDWENVKQTNPSAFKAVETIEHKKRTILTEDKIPVEIEYVKVKLYNKVHALEKIDQLMGYKSADKVDLSGDLTANLGTGSVSAIREAFGLKKSK